MNSKPLDIDIKVLDLTHRLPGPLATHLMLEMGAKVTKVEDSKFGDPFLDGFFKEMDPSFSHWYESLNAGKKVIRFSLKEDKEHLHQLIRESDIILMGLPNKLQVSLEIDFEATNNRDRQAKPFVYINMIGSHNSSKGMHDLNALAQNRLLDLYLYEVTHLDLDKNIYPKRIAPPFLPIAGISYGAMLSNCALGALLKARSLGTPVEEVVSLEESVQDLLGPFYCEKLSKTEQKSFLHNGRYPCYNIYPLNDGGHLAVACLEPKYWQIFCQLLGLNLSLEERFHFADEKVFSQIQDRIKELSTKDAQSLFKGQDCCVDPIGAN